jgi:CRISPR-associated protein Cas1
MKKLLNTLYITTQKSYLKKERQTVVVKNNKTKVAQFPIHTLDGIICFGNISISPYLLGLCSENNVTVSFFTEYGKFLSRVHGAVKGNVLLRRNQYRFADDDSFCRKMISSIVTGKVLNSRTILRRCLRDHGEAIKEADINAACARLKESALKLKDTESQDYLRGIEGESASAYFAVFNELILNDKEYFHFGGRSRRPPLDPVNSLLSFIYTIMMHDICSALEGCGLDPAVGYLHKDRPGRMGLALDLMEEFRPVICDRLVLSLINLKQIQRNDFIASTAGAFTLSDQAKKTVLTAYQNRKREEIYHPYIEEKIPVGLLFHVQAMLLARFIRGDIDGYPVFIWK